MNELFIFTPPRRRGLLFHILPGLVLAGASAAALVVGMDRQNGSYFILLMLLSLALFAPLPLFIYRAYALWRAQYRIERDGLRLRWGMRAEDIPLPEVEWVRQADDLALDLPLPPLSWPGALLGTVDVPDLGPVEYLASTRDKLILVATPNRVYALSPADPAGFMRAFQRSMEMGSLTPISSISLRPATYLSQVWADGLARWPLTASFLLTLLLFVSVSLAISSRPEISMGFYPDGTPLPPARSEQMILLPIVATFIFLTDLVAGLFFYRRSAFRLVSYIVWCSGAVTTLLMLGASLLLILTT